jgi:hypothetical protein
MIVKVCKAYPAGTGRPLTTYVLAAKHEQKGQRLGPYIQDPTSDKIEWSRTVHSGVADPLQAIGAIERYNAQNTRKHSVSRWEHLVVSFSEGERPTRKQMEIIEDRLMAAIGFGDHPRISASHHDTTHSHLHIAVSRIDPTTLKAEHPRGNHFKLQAEAARLELDLGLRQGRKTMLRREREEIASRAAIDSALKDRHLRWDMVDSDGNKESKQMDLSDGTNTISDTQERTNMAPNELGGIWRSLPHEATRAEWARWEAERAEESRAENGLSTARRTADRERQSNRTARQARATPSQALYARYKTEKTIAMGARKQAEQAIYDRFAGYQQQLSGFYNVQHEQQKLVVQRGSERHKEHEVLSASHRGDRVEANRQRAQQLAAVRREHPLPSWESFLERESGRGDREASRMLRQRQERQKQHGLER